MVWDEHGAVRQTETRGVANNQAVPPSDRGMIPALVRALPRAWHRRLARLFRADERNQLAAVTAIRGEVAIEGEELTGIDQLAESD